jgi:LacI family transcriptional regulator
MSRPKSTRINLATIAERLGVSISTVSRALRGMDGIHEETRAQVAALAHQMGYTLRGGPTAPVNSLPLSAPQHVLALSQCTSPHIDQRFMAGMSGAAVAFNVAILTHLVADDQCASVLEARTAPASFRSGLVKGIVLLHRWPDEIAAEICQKSPTVSIVHDYPGANIDLIGIDDRRGMAELINHLHSAGHRRIGFFGLCPEVSWSSARFAAYVEGLTRQGLDINPLDVVRIDLAHALSANEFSCGPYTERVRGRLAKGVDAWICASSMTGQTLCRSLLAAGVRLPQDMSLVSFHGASSATPADLPVITTTYVVDEELGAAAVRRLINRLECPGESRRSILVPARLRIGTTTRASGYQHLASSSKQLVSSL